MIVSRRGKIIRIFEDRLVFNVLFLKRFLKGERIFPVLKSEAYGHGIEIVGRAIENFVDGFCVGRVEEGILLRSITQKPILVLKPSYDCEEFLNFSLWGVSSNVSDAFEKVKRNIKVFLEIDTGMGRLGMIFDEKLVDDILELQKSKNFLGLMTHFAFSDLSSPFVFEQINMFSKIFSLFRGIMGSISNSAGVFLLKEKFHIVRPGIALYGVSPFSKKFDTSMFHVKQDIFDEIERELKPAMEVRTRIIHKKRIPKGWSVGYSRRFIAGDELEIGVLDLGYADGVPRNYWRDGEVIVKGRRCKILGIISMDMLCVLLDGVGANIGDEAIILGEEGQEKITAWEIARKSQTIPYEILLRLGMS